MIMYIQVYDISMKIHFNTAENFVTGLIEKINHCIILVLIYIIILFTDLCPTQEDKYFMGWIFVSILALLLFGNICFMGTLGMIRALKSCRLTLLKLQLKKNK